jgi:hypothetical protein
MADDTNGQARQDESNEGPGEDGHAQESKLREFIDQVKDKVQDVAPVVGERLHDGVDLAARKMREVAPVVGERVGEGAVKVGKAIEDLGHKLQDRAHTGATQPPSNEGDGTESSGGAAGSE